MGAYTKFTLSIIQGDDYVTDYKKEISKQSCYQTDDSLFSNEWKWHSHEYDMRKYSKKHPNTLFELRGIGEDPEDMWREYYLNGKMQHCRAVITYPAFDKNLLQ